MFTKMTTKVYNRTESGKSWKSQPESVETSEIDRKQYENIVDIDTQKFFRRLGGSERMIKNYTCHGYIVVQLTSISPDREIKKVREFSFN